MSSGIEIQLIAIIVALSCVLPGVFLVLRRLSMLVESITHTILLGIVLAFLITHDLNSPFLIIGAALVGVLTSWLTELLSKSRLLSHDACTGVVFTLLFSIAVILLSKFASKVHLCTDAVFMGELAFAPLNRLLVSGYDLGPVALYVSGVILFVNLFIVVLFFKELKLATFDPMLASVLGLSPVVMHYLLMTIVSVTAVGSFQSIGSILVIAFMIGPPVTAYLLTDNLKHMILISAGGAILNSILGYHFAHMLDVSLAGSMSCMIGVSFLLVFIFAPQRGMLSMNRRRRRQKLEFAKSTLLFHLYNHEPRVEREQSIARQLNWSAEFSLLVLQILKKEDKLRISADGVRLSPMGYEQLKQDQQAIFNRL